MKARTILLKRVILLAFTSQLLFFACAHPLHAERKSALTSDSNVQSVTEEVINCQIMPLQASQNDVSVVVIRECPEQLPAYGSGELLGNGPIESDPTGNASIDSFVSDLQIVVSGTSIRLAASDYYLLPDVKEIEILEKDGSIFVRLLSHGWGHLNVDFEISDGRLVKRRVYPRGFYDDSYDETVYVRTIE